MHPAELMRQDPGSPALPFEIAVFTGSEGLNTCASVFQALTTLQQYRDFGGKISLTIIYSVISKAIALSSRPSVLCNFTSQFVYYEINCENRRNN